jgi:drug/metabolite transporter (DMT)-like permease
LSLINIGLITLSCLFHALWNVLTQTSKNSNLFSGLKGVWILGTALVLYLTFDYKSLPADILWWALLSGILHGLYIFCLSKAYHTQDISYVYPIARSAPVFVPLFAWLWLGETLEPIVFLSIGMILLAIYILHFKGNLISGFKNLYDAILHRDLRWAFYTLIMVVSYSLVDKRGMEVFYAHFPDQPVANGIIFFFLEGIVCFTLYFAYLATVHSPREILSAWKADWILSLVAGAATVGSYGIICIVLQFESVSTVVAVRQISVLLVVFWGCWKLGESFGRQRMTAAVH